MLSVSVVAPRATDHQSSPPPLCPLPDEKGLDTWTCLRMDGTVEKQKWRPTCVIRDLSQEICQHFYGPEDPFKRLNTVEGILPVPFSSEAEMGYRLC